MCSGKRSENSQFVPRPVRVGRAACTATRRLLIIERPSITTASEGRLVVHHEKHKQRDSNMPQAIAVHTTPFSLSSQKQVKEKQMENEINVPTLVATQETTKTVDGEPARVLIPIKVNLNS